VLTALAAAVLLVWGAMPVSAAIDGITGPTFNLTAKSGYISTAEGGSYLAWGYANGAGLMQFPGPTLIVNQGDVVTVNLTNTLAVPVSILFPGQAGVAAAGGNPGLLTREAAPAGGTVSYTFTASQPGTYTYYSGTQPDLQVEMGLVGALIVRPSSNPATQAYNHADSAFDHEYLFLLSDLDPNIHDAVAAGNLTPDTTSHFAVYWLINGRTAPDTMSAAGAPWLPHQPYNILPMMHPGERILIRLISAGRDAHPFHTHGNHHRTIARDGRLLSSVPGVSGADLGQQAFTDTTAPGSTMDAIYTWTGVKMGWDFYGHQHDLDNAPTGNFPGPEDVDHNGNGTMDAVPAQPGEDPADHGKPVPVTLPSQETLTFGQFYSGSPFMGALGALPPGEGGFNPNGGFMFMWHSHNEKEIVNFDIFPGGLLTMLLIEHPDVPLSNP
jgi:FtsP/CotA-like multicopper oxidase with cupredoxin domain